VTIDPYLYALSIGLAVAQFAGVVAMIALRRRDTRRADLVADTLTNAADAFRTAHDAAALGETHASDVHYEVGRSLYETAQRLRDG